MKKTVITIETFQRTTIRLRKAAKIAQCDRGAAADAPSEAAALSQIAREVLWLRKTGDINHPEGKTAGASFVPVRSLPEKNKRKNRHESAKRFSFDPNTRTITLLDELTNEDFIALP